VPELKRRIFTIQPLSDANEFVSRCNVQRYFSRAMKESLGSPLRGMFVSQTL
jgi:hypothetical protein